MESASIPKPCCLTILALSAFASRQISSAPRCALRACATKARRYSCRCRSRRSHFRDPNEGAGQPNGHPAVRAWLDRQSAETLYITTTSPSELLLGVEIPPEGKP